MAVDPYLVLARKWRPQTFDDVVGQEHITRTIQNAIASRRIGHAFLFIGSRGVGKTTTARILAKALNCQSTDGPTPTPCGECDNCRTIAAGNSIDVIEIDGASNNTIEDVRQIRENIRLVPSRSRYKVYVIDEVHQLSSAAFNALLKTLEEPPEHAVFILATTEAGKIPATIISRCQRYDFRRIGQEPLMALLRRIASAEKVSVSEEALYAVARAADGGVRDAQSIFEQVISYCGEEVTFKDVFDVLGLVDWSVLHVLCDAILEKNAGRLLELIDDITARGKDLSAFVQDILQYFRNLLVCKTADARKLLALPEAELSEMQNRANAFSLMDLIRLVEQFAELAKDFDSQIAQRIALEALLIRISKVSVEVSLDALLEKIAALGGGVSLPATPSRTVPTPPPGPAPRPARPAPKPSIAEEGNLARTPETRPEPEDTDSGPTQIELIESNAERVWRSFVRSFARRHFGLGIWLGGASVQAVEDDTLVLAFSQSNARDEIEKPENRAALEGALQTATTNIRHIRTTLTNAPGASSSAAAGGAQEPLLPASELRQAMANPKVAQIVDLFKGTIVSVTPPAQEEGE